MHQSSIAPPKRSLSSMHRPQPDRSSTYKALIDNYYDRDHLLGDIKQELYEFTNVVDILGDIGDFQKRIDQLTKTKRYDIQQMFLKPTMKLKRILRIRLSRQPGLVRICGRLHPKADNAAKFTAFFRELSAQISREKVVVETWKKPASNFPERDGLTIKWPGTTNEGVTILLTPITNPPRFHVDPMLQRLIGMRAGTRPQVLEALWNYIRARKLQDSDNKEIINTDQGLKQLFKCDKLVFPTVSSRIRDFLTPIDSIQLCLSSGQTCKIFDMVVEVESRPQIDIIPFFSHKFSQDKNQHPFLHLIAKVRKYDKKLQEHAEKLRRHLKKRNIYKDFSVESVEKLLKEQNQLLKDLKELPADDRSKLEVVLENQEELEREIRQYYEQVTGMNG